MVLGAPAKNVRIRRILIVHKDIFDTSLPSENKLIFKAVNALHISTKEKVIRQELLLREGGIYDPRLAKESERALRKILQLRGVRVTPMAVDNDTVDLMVTVHETWTTEPMLSVSGVGKDLSGKIGFRERNLLGYGKKANFTYKKSADIISRSLSYDDPDILKTRLRLNAKYEDGEEGTLRSFGLERPFYSSITPWSAGFLASSQEGEPRLLEAGEEVSRFNNESRSFSGILGRSLGSTPERLRRATLGYRYQESRLFSALPAREILQDQRYHFFTVGTHLERVNFVTVDHIKQSDREEDFNLGPSLVLEPGFARRRWIRESGNANLFRLESFAGTSYGPSHFGLLTLKGEGRYEDRRWNDTRMRLDLEYYNHFRVQQTFACHFQAEQIFHPSEASQILLGGDKGLRGYPINHFAGNKLMLLNVENRFFLVDDIWRILSLGSVVFFDSGYVWGRGRAIQWKDVRMNVGTGLRFHLTRTSVGHVLRFDVAYALQESERKDRVILTFGSDQAF